MQTFAFICGVIGIALSMILLTRFAIREHKLDKRRTLSEHAVKNSKNLKEFRIILWTCGTLISVMMYFLVIPNSSYSLLLATTYTIIIICEMTLGIIPADYSKKQGKIHDALAYTMTTGMWLLTLIFAIISIDKFAIIQSIIFGIMTAVCLITFRYWQHFIYFELPFIFLSHASILLAAASVT